MLGFASSVGWKHLQTVSLLRPFVLLAVSPQLEKDWEHVGQSTHFPRKVVLMSVAGQVTGQVLEGAGAGDPHHLPPC